MQISQKAVLYFTVPGLAKVGVVGSNPIARSMIPNSYFRKGAEQTPVG